MKAYRTSIISAHVARQIGKQLLPLTGTSAHAQHACNQYTMYATVYVKASRIAIYVTAHLNRQNTHLTGLGRASTVYRGEGEVKLTRSERNRLAMETELTERAVTLVERRVAHLCELAREAATDQVHAARERVWLEAQRRRIDAEAADATGREQCYDRMDLPTTRFWDQWLSSQPLSL